MEAVEAVEAAAGKLDGQTAVIQDFIIWQIANEAGDGRGARQRTVQRGYCLLRWYYLTNYSTLYNIEL